MKKLLQNKNSKDFKIMVYNITISASSASYLKVLRSLMWTAKQKAVQLVSDSVQYQLSGSISRYYQEV